VVRDFSAPYLTTLVTTLVLTASLTIGARRYPGRWVRAADFALAGLLTAVTGAWLAQTATEANWSAATSLPFALCDIATLIAAAALVTLSPLLVELTYFWGLAGTLQALLTPDLSAPFPSLTFFEYVIAHAGIVCAAIVLVAGQGLAPRPRAVPRIFAVTLVYTGFVGILDATTGGDYMFLRSPPSNWTLLSALGPWPWYIVSAAGVAIVLFTALDAPFWRARVITTGNPARTGVATTQVEGVRRL
jgi:hypothetical integral membrane protein (TIGR02206 family)